MTDEDYKDLVTAHDKSIGVMASSIEHVAIGLAAMNSKLSDIIDVIGQQNILMEKFTNLESNLKESFDRVHDKTGELEKDVENLEIKTESMISPTTLRWMAGLVLVYTLTFGTYVVTSIHTLDTITTSHVLESRLINDSQDRRIEQNALNNNRNYGQIQGYFKHESHKDTDVHSKP